MSNLLMHGDDHRFYKVGNQIKCIQNELSVETEIAFRSIKPKSIEIQRYRIQSNHDDFTLRTDEHNIVCLDYLKILGVNFDNAILARVFLLFVSYSVSLLIILLHNLTSENSRNNQVHYMFYGVLKKYSG